jgi:hypothetical protein
MKNFKRAAFRSMTCVGVTAIAAASSAAGCGGGDDSSSSTSTVTATATVTTTATGSTSSSSKVSSSISGSGTTSTVASSSSTSSSTSSASDGGPGDGAPGDGAPSDGAPSDASDSGGCTTTVAALAGAGDGGAVSPQLLFGFDNGLTATTGAWANEADGTMTASTDGHTCPGSLLVTTSFSKSQYPILAQFAYTAAANWTGYTKLHMWVKVTTTSYATLGLVQAWENDNVSPGGFYAPDPMYGTTPWSDGGWHEVVLTLTPAPVSDAGAANYDPTKVGEFGVQAGASSYDGGAFPLVSFNVDDIWLQ